MEIIQFDHFNNDTNISHFISTRKDGYSKKPFDSLNLTSKDGDNEEDVAMNLKKLKTFLNIESQKDILIPKQTHSTNVKLVNESTQKSELNNTDAIITNTNNLYIGILTADCMPILVYDKKQKVVAAIHAGWKGAIEGIIENTFLLMLNKFQTKPVDCIIGIGPCISVKNYEIGNDVIKIIKNAFPYYKYILNKHEHKEKAYLDLVKLATIKLLSLGVLQENIETTGMCTFKDEERFFSYRRNGKTGRILTGIMLK